MTTTRPTLILHAAAGLLARCAAAAVAGEFTGQVVGITDGDTISVLHNGKSRKVRLNGIDCPENGQPFSVRAKHVASQLAFKQDVTVTDHGRDKYGRTIGDVVLPDGKNLNHELVRAGLCWWYRKYSPTDTILEQLEAEGRDEKRGLWVYADRIPPWEWRHRFEEAR